MMNIVELPSDVLKGIFSFINQNTLIHNVSLSCKLFSQVALDVLSNYDLNVGYIVPTPPFRTLRKFEAIETTRFTPLVKSLAIFGNHKDYDVAHMIKNSNCSQYLRKVVIQGDVSSTIQNGLLETICELPILKLKLLDLTIPKTFQNYDKLPKKLHLHNVSGIIDFSYLTKVETLGLHSMSLPPNFTPPPKLQRFFLFEGNTKSKTSLEEYYSSLAKLPCSITIQDINGTFISADRVKKAIISRMKLLMKKEYHKLISLNDRCGDTILSFAGSCLAFQREIRNDLSIKIDNDIFRFPYYKCNKLIDSSLKEIRELYLELLSSGIQIPQEVLKRPLRLACVSADIELVQKLLECGADVNSRDSVQYIEQGMFKHITPLAWTIEAFLRCEPCEIKENFLEILKILLLSKADPNVVCRDGCTPLTHAVIRGSEELVALLLDAPIPANPNLEMPYCFIYTLTIVGPSKYHDYSGYSALDTLFAHKATIKDSSYEEIMKLLLAKGAKFITQGSK